MNISSYSVASNSSDYVTEKASPASSKHFSVSDPPPTAPAPPPVPAPDNPNSEAYPNSPDDYYASSAFQQVDSQRKQEADEEKEKEQTLFQPDEEEDEEKEEEPMIDYLLEALKGEEKDIRMEGNKHIDRWKYLNIHFPELMSAGLSGMSS